MKMKPENKSLNYWSRKTHIHLGLFLLLFICLFSISGLLLNHSSKWKFAGFWDERKVKIAVDSIYVPAGLDSVARLKNIMKQLKISGEVSGVWLSADSIDFKVSRPGRERNLHVDLEKGICRQTDITFNWWGKIRTLHSFNGVNKNNRELRPNWIITRLWQFSMNAIAAGLIIICITSWITWFKSKKSLVTGSILLITGFAIVIYFVFLIKIL
jgi:hypothetical protein